MGPYVGGQVHDTRVLTGATGREIPMDRESGLFGRLQRNWWLFLLRGILAILFGIVAWIWPGLTLTMLVVFAGAWLMVDGIAELYATIKHRDIIDRIWPFILSAIVSIIAGFVIWLWPGLSAYMLIIFIGVFAIIHGILAIVSAISLRREIDNEWSIGGMGLLAVLFGLMMVIFPGAGALSLIWMIAIFSIAMGIMLIAFAFRLKNA